jgi:non-ribosomal peptide synthetase-like protein
VDPGRPVTIGVPLPTYSVVVLDPDSATALPPGAMGEIGIAGIGLASGYLGRPDLTERAFVPDFLGIPDNPGGRIYRTGDLGRVNADGEIEHHGRIDTQVKIRGYRIELAEIESVLLRVPGIAQAVVSTWESGPGVVELAAYYTARGDGQAVDPLRAYAQLREQLPGYMVPAYLEQLAVIPVLPSGKADRASLPPPRGRRMAAGGDHVLPAGDTERALAEALAAVLDIDRVSVDGHFFDDLGASSLLMARFSAAIRERGGLPPVSMKDIYLHPTVRDLAAALAGSGMDRPGSAREPAAAGLVEATVLDASPAKGTPVFVLCGILQLLAFLVYVGGVSLALDAGASWALAARSALGIYARLVAFGGGGLLALGTAPVVAKWILIGRWKQRRIRAWSIGYFRFWLVKTMTVANPMARMLVGTPLYTVYLRALGAKVGRHAAIFTQHAPVCADLLTIGAGSVIRKDVFISGYRARSGVIETGPVVLGQETFVGEHTVIDIFTAVGDGAQLGHSSALLAGQAVPAGACWPGSPAVPADPGWDYRTVPPAHCGVLRRASCCVIRLLFLVTVAGPAAAVAASLLLLRPSLLVRPLEPADLAGWGFYCEVGAVAAALLIAAIPAGLVIAGTAPRVLAMALRPGRAYPLYGFHHAVQRAVSRLSNVKFFNALLGDTSAIVGYLRLLGYRLTPVEQTGSNFGMEIKHEVPTLAVVGTGTMISDGLSIMNAEFSSSSFRVCPTAIGTRNFLGNAIAYPADGRTGDNCLLATKVMIPVGGPVREGVGLLGSPCFEIPRTVRSDHRFDRLGTARRRRHRLKAKNRHNAVTIGEHLLVRWIYVWGLLLVAVLPFGVWLPSLRSGMASDALGTAAAALLDVAFTVGYFVLVERVVTGFRGLRPRFCSIYQPEFWEHERYWKVPSISYIQIFNGTPFKSLVWRLLGVKVGRRVLDDGCSIVERTLVTIGSRTTLGAGSILQGHSLEDGTFKSGYIEIGDDCTIGTGAFVHYGVTMDDGADLDADSFLMKGEHVPAGSRWAGNPAESIQAPAAIPAQRPRAASASGTSPSRAPATTRDAAAVSAKSKASVPVEELWAAAFAQESALQPATPSRPS